MNTKYVVIEHPSIGETMYIFPEYIVHREAARNNTMMGDKIIAAGFIAVEQEGLLMCYGRSESLNINSRPEEDSVLINKMFGRV